MKTIKKIAWLFLFAFFLIACEKENLKSTNEQEPTSVDKKALINCTPTQNVTGIWTALNTIESFSNCVGMDCMGESVLTLIVNHYLLTDMNTNSIFLIYNNVPVTPAEQINIIASAKNWANVNAPAGYFVYYIDYIPNIIVGSPVASVIDIKVTYRKCIGITPPPAD
jgi:hypothetical protein